MHSSSTAPLLCIAAAFAACAGSALAQPPGTESIPEDPLPQYEARPAAPASHIENGAPVSTAPSGSPQSNWSQVHAVAPRSRLAMRLNAPSQPSEAEVRCSLTSNCLGGLTRGFSVGSDLSRVISTPLIRSRQVPGSWGFTDVFLGYQFLRGVDDSFYASGNLGYRGFSYMDSEARKAETAGLTFHAAYGQQITPAYAQGIEISGFQQTSKTNFERLLPSGSDAGSGEIQDGAEARETFRRFYAFYQIFPKVHASLPAEIEVANWRASDLDLPNHLRLFTVVVPYYSETELELGRNWYSLEKRWGLKTSALLSYESPTSKSGRFVLSGGPGVDLGRSTLSLDDSMPLSKAPLDLRKQGALSLLFDVSGSYQF